MINDAIGNLNEEGLVIEVKKQGEDCFPPKKLPNISMYNNEKEATKVHLLRKAALKAREDKQLEVYELTAKLEITLRIFIAEKHEQERGDLDNYTSGILDALQPANENMDDIYFAGCFQEYLVDDGEGRKLSPREPIIFVNDKSIRSIHASFEPLAKGEHAHYIINIKHI
jgi:Holliday junction resolvase RusA-like endonuclease